MESEPQPLVVPPVRVFNLPLFELYLVIDVRLSKAFNDEHIVTACNFEPKQESSTETMKRLLHLFQHLVDIGTIPENTSPVVLYGDSSTDTHLQWYLSYNIFPNN